MNNTFIDSATLKDTWINWQISGDSGNWQNLNLMVYNISSNIVHCKFFSTNADLDDLTQDTYIYVMNKIRDGKMIYNPDYGKPFNLLTTTTIRSIINILDKTNRKNTNFKSMCDKISGHFYKNLKLITNE